MERKAKLRVEAVAELFEKKAADALASMREECCGLWDFGVIEAMFVLWRRQCLQSVGAQHGGVFCGPHVHLLLESLNSLT